MASLSTSRERLQSSVGLCEHVMIAAIVTAALLHNGCSGPVAHLVITAPSTAVAGSPVTVTVAAMVDQNPDTIFNSVIHFSSSDQAAVLPPDYVFTEADAGSHTFTNGVTFMTPGSQTITATDTATSFLTASTTVTVSSIADAVQ